MKKLFLIAVAMVCFSYQAAAQFSAGITGGLNLLHFKEHRVGSKNTPGFTAGLTCNIDLPYGFTIQPSATFASKKSNLTEVSEFTMNYLEVPVSFQWGPDLLIFRPFVDVTPFFGVMLNNNVTTYGNEGQVVATSWTRDGRQIVEYGVGVGGGIDIWKLRFIARYNWNFGQVFNKKNIGSPGFTGDHFAGLTLGVSMFFF